jgi:D-alanyl-D-alanine dipeptidase
MSTAVSHYPVLFPKSRALLLHAQRGLPLVIACIVFGLFPNPLHARDFFPAVQNSQILKKAAAMGLLPVQGNIPGTVVDLRYATPDNITNRALYPPDMPCLLHPMTLTRLKRAQKTLRRQGLRLKIWDAYRPPEAHLELWQSSKASDFVVPPDKGPSLHCYGVAVDVTLVDKQGRPLMMPTDHDEFSAAAASNYTGDNPAIRNNLETLQKAMKKAGFSTIESEWWHFVNLEPQGARVIYASQLGIQLPLNPSLKATPVKPVDSSHP